MKLERMVSLTQSGNLFVSSIGVLDVGQTYAVCCAPNIAVFHVWDPETYMEYAYTHKGNAIPAIFLNKIGLAYGNKVRIMKDDSCVFLFRSDFNGDLSELNAHMPFRAAINDAPVLPETISDLPVHLSSIILPSTDWNIATYRVNGDRFWVELRRQKEEYQELIPESRLIHLGMPDGFSYQIEPIHRSWHLPKKFTELVKNAPVQVGMVNDVFIIEGKQVCSICNNSIGTSSKYVKGWACPKCAKQLGKDGIMDALVKTARIIKQQGEMQ